MIEIDGNYGEGGGQILRTSLSLSCLLRKPFRIFNIRKNRKKPGLMPQHLTSVRAAQLITNGKIKGDYTGSEELLFFPGEARTGEYFFDIGTAGSTSLVLLALVPVLAFLGDKSTLILTGGTHVPLSPSFHDLSEVFRHFLGLIGVKVYFNIESYGFYPRGGGKLRADIFPTKTVSPLNIPERGIMRELTGCSGVANLPLSIAERQKNALLEKIRSGIKEINCPFIIESVDVTSPGQGTFVHLVAKSEYSIAGFTALGAKGKMAETVGEEAAEEFIAFYSSNAALDKHMADQIVLYLSLCPEESSFTVSSITQHLLTNLWAIGLFHEIRYSIEGEIGGKGTVTVKGSKL